MDVRRQSPANYLFAARAVRDFGDGFVAVLLPVYLLALGFTPLNVGVIATASLLGSSLLTIAAGFLGVRHDHRRLLIAAACLMVATGVAFALIHDYALLLVVAFVGTVNPSSGSVSVFVPLEHAVLSGQVRDADRTGMFARYSLVGALAGACGSLAAAIPDVLAPATIGQIAAIKLMFVLYAVLGVVGGLFYARIPQRPPAAETAAAGALGPSRGSSTGSRCCSASTPSPAASSCSRCWRCGCSSGSTCRFRRPSLFFFWSGVLVGVLVPGRRLAVAAHRARSTRWCSPTSLQHLR